MITSWKLLLRLVSWRALCASTCTPCAVAGAVAAGALSWVMLVVLTAISGVVGLAVALPDAGDHPDRRTGLATVGCVVLIWWVGVSFIVLPMVSAWLLVAMVVLGGALGGLRAGRARHRLAAAVATWFDVAQLAYQPAQLRWAVLARAPDEDLCTMWERSGDRMMRSFFLSTLAAYTDLRQALLDELESRDPDAFAEWLDRPDTTDMHRYLAKRTSAR